MDRKNFRQIDERYVAGKALDEASLDNIVDGVYNPVEEMKYATEPRRSNSSAADNEVPWVPIIIGAIGAIVALFCKYAF